MGFLAGVVTRGHAESALRVPNQALVDAHIFERARGVLDALDAHDCAPALAWAEEHRPRLRKLKSKLEFKLRVQVRAFLLGPGLGTEWPGMILADQLWGY